MKVNGKDDIPYTMENKKCLKPPTRIVLHKSSNPVFVLFPKPAVYDIRQKSVLCSSFWNTVDGCEVTSFSRWCSHAIQFMNMVAFNLLDPFGGTGLPAAIFTAGFSYEVEVAVPEARVGATPWWIHDLKWEAKSTWLVVDVYPSEQYMLNIWLIYGYYMLLYG